MIPVAILLLCLLFYQSSASLTLRDARLFVNSVKNGKFCSPEFLNLLNSDLKEPVLLLYIDSCSNSTVKDEPKNLYGKLKLAHILRNTGKESEARRLYLSIFSSTNDLDEDILLKNIKNPDYLFKPGILRTKVWMAAREGELGLARFYLSYLRDDPYYTYLLAYIFLKSGNRKIARELFNASLLDEKYYFLMLLSSELPEKENYYEKLMNSTARTSFKKAATFYILDRLFPTDLGLFRKALSRAKVFLEIYNYYLTRYYAYIGNCESLKRLEHNSETASVIYSICSDRNWNTRKVDFYSLLLSPPKRFPYNRKKVFSSMKLKDRGLSYLYRKGFCSAISFIDRPSPQNALAQYLCGNFKKGIELAAPYKNNISRYPYILAVLYPNPPIFKDDVVSLAIARQESLFDRKAVSRSGAIGLMQITPSTGEYIAEQLNVNGFKINHLYRPEVNYRFGSYYIHSLLKQFGLFPLAAAAYNCGPTRVKEALKLYGAVRNPEDLILFTEVYLPYQETRDYVKKTFINLYYYSNLYGKGNEWKIFSTH